MRGRSGAERPVTSGRAVRLRRLVGHAYERVPFYRERFDRAGVTPADIRTLDDLSRLPVTEKADLIDRPVEAIVARGVDPQGLVSTLTSGYSGEPFLVRRTRREQARWARGWLEDLIRAGLRTGDRVATLFSLRRERPEGAGPFAALGVLHETAVDCAREPGEILELLEAARPTFVRGMAGVIARLADEIARTDRGTIRPRVVWVSGEVLTPSARQLIEAAFRAPVHNAYGTHEVGLVAADCRSSGLMHLGQPGLVVEVLGSDGRPSGAGETGEVVVTALDFLAAPFIRYRLTDVVTRGADPCPCGENTPTLAHIEGRTIDYFQMPDGRMLHPYRILGPAIAVAPPIRQYQLVQEARDRIVLKLVCEAPLDDEDRRRLRESVEPLLGPGVGFRIETVSSIPANPSGKSRPVLTLVGR